MKSITIHGVDDELARRIDERSKEHGVSRNKTIKALLHESLEGPAVSDREREFADLFGTWSSQQKAQFDENAQRFGRIDASDWESS